MAKKLYEESSVQDIAAAIREKNGGTATYKIAEMGAAVRAIPTSEAVQWHQCPEAVRNFLANVTYDPSDYSTSQIDNYAPAWRTRSPPAPSACGPTAPPGAGPTGPRSGGSRWHFDEKFIREIHN